MAKTAFFSFDHDRDRNLKQHMAGQLKLRASPFKAANWSRKDETLEHDWQADAIARIRRSDVVVVLVGENTHKSPVVLKEVEMTRKMGRPIVQIIGYEGTSPTPVPNAGELHSWTWKNMTKDLK